MKKTAIKGLIILAIVVLVCIFFSGTLHTITTAKVRITKAKTGRLETEITMTGKLQWPETVNLTVEGLGGDDTLIVRSTTAAAGAYVRAGDLLAECVVSNYDGRLETLQSSSAGKEKELLELERKNSSLMLTDQQEAWFAAYKRVQAAGSETQALRQDLRLAAWKAGVTLGEGDTVPEGTADETLAELRAGLTAAEAEEAAAQAALDGMKWLNISEEAVTYLDKKDELEKDLAKLSEEITALRILNEQSAAIRAPHDGYITATDLKAGDQISRDSVIASMTAPGTEPVIRLDPGDTRRTVENGTPVTLTAGDKTTDSEICGQGVRADGGLYLDASLSRGALAALGGSSATSEDKAVTAKMVYQSENATTLIPATALRGSSGNYYIYTATSSTNNLGAEQYNIERKNVTVLGMNDTMASIEEALKNDAIVYLEDRQLTDGCEVMLY